MNGQWVGTYAGSNSGNIIVDIDVVRSRFVGIAYLQDTGTNMPAAIAFFQTFNLALAGTKIPVAIFWTDPTTSEPVTWDVVKGRYPNVTAAPTTAELDYSVVGNQLDLKWTTNIGSFGSAGLPKSKAADPSQLAAKKMNWLQFKRHVATLESRRYIFRGQKDVWRLRTNFHRTGRAHLRRFLLEDIPTLYRRITSQTRHVFNLKDADENGAFLNLVQHHGFPTPLLDWTYSPYVAAFFACSKISPAEVLKVKKTDRMRILVFDQLEWQSSVRQLGKLDMPTPHLSVVEFLSIENPRMVPQQGVSTVTNMDDIETYIASWEQRLNKSFLYAIDIPVRGRSAVMNELGSMGITAGSLFPGLDGTCEELKERLFP